MNRSEYHKTCRLGAYMLDTHILFFSGFLQFFLDVYLVKKSMCWHCEVFRAWESKLQAWSLLSQVLISHGRALFLLRSVSTQSRTLSEHLHTWQTYIAFFQNYTDFAWVPIASDMKKSTSPGWWFSHDTQSLKHFLWLCLACILDMSEHN